MDKSSAWSSFQGDYLTPRHMLPWWQFHVSLIFFCSSLLFLLSFRLPPTHGRSVLRLPFDQWIFLIICHWENNFPKAKMHIFTLTPLLILHFGVHGNVLNIYCKYFWGQASSESFTYVREIYFRCLQYPIKNFRGIFQTTYSFVSLVLPSEFHGCENFSIDTETLTLDVVITARRSYGNFGKKVRDPIQSCCNNSLCPENILTQGKLSKTT